MTSTGAIVNGKQIQIPGLACSSWLDDPVLKLGTQDKRPRLTRWVRSVVLHTTKGIPGGADLRPQVILPGLGTPSDAGERCARLWSTDGRAAGAHLVVDRDGSVSCLADLLVDAAYHAGPVNEVSVGVEIYQGEQAELYEGQLAAVVLLCDWMTATFGIQRQVPVAAQAGVVPRMERGGEDVVGVYGHRNVTSNRGIGDPGDAVFDRLRAAGYEAFDFAQDADLAAWKSRQNVLQVPADGVPGPQTVAALRAASHADGLWVSRAAPAAV